MDLPALIKEHPVYMVGGAAVGLYLLSTFFGGNTAPASIDYGSGSGIATGSPADSSGVSGADVANQIAASQQATMASVGQMLQGYQDTETQAMQAMSQGFSQTLANMQTQSTAMQQAMETEIQQGQAQNVATMNAMTQGLLTTIQQSQTQNQAGIKALADQTQAGMQTLSNSIVAGQAAAAAQEQTFLNTLMSAVKTPAPAAPVYAPAYIPPAVSPTPAPVVSSGGGAPYQVIQSSSPVSYVDHYVTVPTVSISSNGVISTAAPSSLPPSIAASYPGATNVTKTDNGYNFTTPSGGMTHYVGNS